MKLFEEFREYETLWNDLTEAATTIRNEYDELLCSINDRADFIKKAQEIYINMPVDHGFEFRYSYGGRIFLTKQADGTLDSHVLNIGHSIIEARNAVSVLKADAADSTITTVTRHWDPTLKSYSYTMGAKLITRDGSVPAFWKWEK